MTKVSSGVTCVVCKGNVPRDEGVVRCGMQSDVTSWADVYITAYRQTVGNVPGQENPNATKRHICWQSGFRDRWWNGAWSRHGGHVS